MSKAVVIEARREDAYFLARKNMRGAPGHETAEGKGDATVLRVDALARRIADAVNSGAESVTIEIAG